MPLRPCLWPGGPLVHRVLGDHGRRGRRRPHLRRVRRLAPRVPDVPERDGTSHWRQGGGAQTDREALRPQGAGQQWQGVRWCWPRQQAPPADAGGHGRFFIAVLSAEHQGCRAGRRQLQVLHQRRWSVDGDALKRLAASAGPARCQAEPSLWLAASPQHGAWGMGCCSTRSQASGNRMACRCIPSLDNAHRRGLHFHGPGRLGGQRRLEGCEPLLARVGCPAGWIEGGCQNRLPTAPVAARPGMAPQLVPCDAVGVRQRPWLHDGLPCRVVEGVVARTDYLRHRWRRAWIGTPGGPRGALLHDYSYGRDSDTGFHV